MTTLAATTTGDSAAPPVLLLHGLLGSARNLHRLAQAIAAAGFFVVSYDQRGHGHSPHADDYRLASLASDVFEVMDRYKIATAHLVGHSMGARVSLAAAGLRPERVRSLVLLDSGVSIRPEHLASLRDIIEPLPASYPSRAAAEDDLTRHTKAFRQFLLSNLRADAEPPHVLRWVFDLKGIRGELINTIQADQSATWKSIRQPVLIARGERSESMTSLDLDEMTRQNPRARAAVIAGAGHWVHVDNFQATVDLVTTFLISLEKKS